MFAIIGIFVVLGAVIGGYLIEHGNMKMIFQPIEILIIGGAATGAFLISSPKTVFMGTIKNIMTVFTGKESTKEDYIALLSVLYSLMNIARRDGLVAIEPHVNKPENSKVFSNYPNILKDHHVMDFICDNFKVLLSGNIESHQIESLMDVDIATHHHHALIPSQAIAKVADALPGLGIVAAVLGVVLTMAKINEPPEVLGESIGAALVGTFMGVLMCYGFVGPISQNLEHQAKGHGVKLEVVKTGIVGFVGGFSPIVALEAARRAIPGSARPSADEMEGALKNVAKQQ